MEKSRIDKYWVPRRLGGGKGGESRRDREDEAYVKELKRELRSQELEKKQKTQEGEVIKVTKQASAVNTNHGFVAKTLAQNLNPTQKPAEE